MLNVSIIFHGFDIIVNVAIFPISFSSCLFVVLISQNVTLLKLLIISKSLFFVVVVVVGRFFKIFYIYNHVDFE